ncbi:MAG: short-chain dehydrogenase/reductase [Gemmatimonadetes bacterium]|nr:short-chain dehydrogenase/reductase [Gemmatimonadota bacterium]
MSAATTKGTALVTGASRGIGRACALRLARDGHHVIAAARHAGELALLAEEVRALGGSCDPLVLDVTDAAAVAHLLAGREVDVLVNNAGVGIMKPFVELSPDEWNRMVDVNVNAIFHVTRAVLPGMLERERGHVVIIGSIAGRSAFTGGTAYTGTKHFVMGFAESLMLEVRDQGVKVTVVSPGSVATDFSPGSRKDWALEAEDVAESVGWVVATPPGVLLHRVEVRALSPKRPRR